MLTLMTRMPAASQFAEDMLLLHKCSPWYGIGGRFPRPRWGRAMVAQANGTRGRANVLVYPSVDRKAVDSIVGLLI